MLIHCHPSGDATPSDEDKYVCLQQVKCMEVLGVELLDFIMTTWRILPLLKWRDEYTIFPFLQKYQITLKMISY